jgi:Flp pilus assembly protein TadG
VTAPAVTLPVVTPTRRNKRASDQRGLTTLETVLVAPALLLVIFSCMQFALWYYAGSVARAAATEAAEAGAAAGPGADAATTRADQVLDTAGNGLLHDQTVAVSVNGQFVRVTVRATAPSLVLGIKLTVNATSSAPVEAFQPQTRQ